MRRLLLLAATLVALACTHWVLDADATQGADGLADPGGDPGSDPGPDAEAVGDEVTPGCTTECGPVDCLADQCCEQGLCHDQDPVPVTCGWYLPGQSGLDEMCRVEAGGYFAGCDAGTAGCTADAQPKVKFQLTKAVWIDRFEVTNLRYAAFLADGVNSGVSAPDCDSGTDLWNLSTRTLLEPWRESHPVVCVSAAEAAAYCASAGKTLPTEATWEAAARGTGALPFPWEGEFDTHNAQCLRNWSNYQQATQCADTWPANTCEGADDVPNTVCKQKTAPAYFGDEEDPACSLPGGVSPVGLCHPAGNAAEWVADGWQSGHEAWGCDGGTGCATAPFVTPSEGGSRVVRGGSWDSTVDELRTWARAGKAGVTRSNKIGFRCAWTGP